MLLDFENVDEIKVDKIVVARRAPSNKLYVRGGNNYENRVLESLDFYYNLLGDYFEIAISDFYSNEELNKIEELNRKLKQEEMDFINH